MWENMNISKLRVSGIFLLEAEIYADPNIWEKWISIIRKSRGKHKHFKFMGFLKILDEAEIHTIPKTWEKWILIIREKYGEKTNIPKFLKYFGWSRNPYNSQNMGKLNSHSKGKILANTNISKIVFLKFFAWCRNPCSSQNMGKVDFHYTGKVWKNTNNSNLWVS